MPKFELKKEYWFLYPRHNFHGVLSRLEPRRLRVEEIRDIRKVPLAIVTVDLQPLLRRGRLLVTGWDLDKQEERSFYADSMKSLEPL